MHYVGPHLHFGPFPADELVRRFGSPLYVYEADIIRRQADRIERAFAALPLRSFYAMKANSSVAILRILAERDLGFDAVSPGEIFIAKRAGITGERIWFTCSNVSDHDLLSLGDPSIVININSMSEIDRCIRLHLRNPLAIRINPEIGAGHHRDVITGGFGVKFGIDPAELDEARMVAEDGGLQVIGLHAHIGSGIDSIDPLLASARILLGLSDALPHLAWINFGGGFSVPYAPGEREFPIEEYGARLTEIAQPALSRRKLGAIVEPGRYVVAQSGTLLSTVTARRVSSGFSWIGCDTGFNHLVRPSRYGAYHHILNASRGGERWLRDRFDVADEEKEEAIVAGNLCESGDVFTRNLEGPIPRVIPRTRIGDLIALCDTGAYGFSMASHYNARLLPAEVLIDAGEVHSIRKRQAFEDLVRGEE